MEPVITDLAERCDRFACTILLQHSWNVDGTWYSFKSDFCTEPLAYLVSRGLAEYQDDTKIAFRFIEKASMADKGYMSEVRKRSVELFELVFKATMRFPGGSHLEFYSKPEFSPTTYVYKLSHYNWHFSRVIDMGIYGNMQIPTDDLAQRVALDLMNGLFREIIKD